MYRKARLLYVGIACLMVGIALFVALGRYIREEFRLKEICTERVEAVLVSTEFYGSVGDYRVVNEYQVVTEEGRVLFRLSDVCVDRVDYSVDEVVYCYLDLSGTELYISNEMSQRKIFLLSGAIFITLTGIYFLIWWYYSVE